jgi:hypothetical protein
MTFRLLPGIAALLLCAVSPMFAATPDAETSVPMTGVSMSFAARTLYKELDWTAYTLDYLKLAQARKFASVMHDPALVAAEVAKAGVTLREQANAHPVKCQYFDLVGSVVAAQPSKKGMALATIESSTASGVFVVDAQFEQKGRFILNSYVVLLANPRVGSQFTVKTSALTTMDAQRPTSSDDVTSGGYAPPKSNQSQQVYLRFDVDLVSMHQGSFANAAIRRVRWFSDPARTQLVAEVSDTSSAAKMVASRYLSEGVTFGAIPDHGTTVGGLQPHELIEQDDPDQSCAEKPRQQGHRVFLCRSTYAAGTTDYAAGEFLYVGGRRVQLSVFASESFGALDESVFYNAIASKYSVKPNELKVAKMWVSDLMQFKLDAAARKTIDKPYLVATSKYYLAMLAGDPAFAVQK